MDFGRTVVPYDVRIRYTMADGSTVVRYYDRATYDELYAIAQLDASDEISELQRATITSDVSGISASAATAVGNSSAHQAYLSGSVYLSDPYYASPVLLTCTEQAKGQLLAALADDVSRQSVEDRYHPSATARGILMFTQSGTQDAQSFSYSLSNTVIYLTDEFTETLAWLDENGLSGYLAAKDSSVIESLTFQRYDPYAGMNKVTKPFSVLFKGYRSTNASSFIVTQDFGTKYATTDAGELAELIPLLRNTYYMDGGGYLVQAKLGGVNAYAYYFLPDSAVPEWLLRVAG